MTVPFLLMVFSGVLWLLMETVATPNNEKEWPNFHRWLKEVCRIIFAASILIILYSVVNKTIF
jgi:hypothetical protein